MKQERTGSDWARLLEHIKKLESNEDQLLKLNNGRQQSGRIFKRK
jgi:hypothetical protein